MSSTPEESKPAILHDPNSRSSTENKPLPPSHRPANPMIHPRITSDHATTWSRDEDGRPVTLHHSWHPHHPAPRPEHRELQPRELHPQHRELQSREYYRRDPRRSPEYYYRPHSRQHAPYRHYEERGAMRGYDYYKRDEREVKTGLLLPPHDEYRRPSLPTGSIGGPIGAGPIGLGATGASIGMGTHPHGCSCKKSKCLKLYCACFSNSSLCRPECRCENCLNSAEEERKDGAIEVARRAVLERNPKAFDDKIGGSVGSVGSIGLGVHSHGAVGPEVGLVRPVFSRAVPRRMEWDFRSLERVRTESVSPRLEGPPVPNLAAVPMPALPPVEVRPEPTVAVREVGASKLTDNASEGSTRKESNASDIHITKAIDNEAAKSEGPANATNVNPAIMERKTEPEPLLHAPNPNFSINRPYTRSPQYYRPSPTYRYDRYPRDSRYFQPYYDPPIHHPRDYPYHPEPKQHRVGCKCKKSMCLKKYCECFQNGIQCGITCKCVNCGNKPGGVKKGATEEAVALVSLGQTVSLESEETPQLKDVERPSSLPSLGSTNHTDEESLKENTLKDKPCEKNLDFLAALATSALDDLKRDKRKAEEMESNGSTENKRSCYDEYYERYKMHHWNPPEQQTLKPITTQFHNQTIPPTKKPAKLPKGLTFRKVCSNCGRQRAEHGEFGFGNKCPLTTCGKCGASAECHEKHKVAMGVTCTLVESEGAIAGNAVKYEAMLADLAARAEIRAEMGRGD